MARKRLRAPIKVPGEYAGFRLNDGRFLIDVLGERFFLPESASKGAPGGIGAPSGPAIPDDDNEAGFTNLPVGPEEGDMAAGSSVSGQRPGGGRIENPGRRPEEAEKPEFTSADILDPRDRREFESLEIAMQGAERKIALHEDRLDLYERRFENKRIDARAMGRARRYFELRIGQQEALIARNENRLTEIRTGALLDAAALSPGNTPRAEDAREDGAPVFPTAGPRPANFRSGMPGGAEDARNDEGFWTLSLPLTAAGQVDESALRPGAVYRIPDSAGGGTGQWKNGAFYNFDQKGDWRLRMVTDLDAYSGASDAPTPEERDAEALADIEEGLENIKAGSAFTPAVYATKEELDRFNEADRGGIRAVGGDDEIVFDLGDGAEFLALPDDAAAYVLRNWEKYEPRLAFLSKLQDETLSPEERRRLVEEEVYRDVREAESRGPISPAGGRGAAMLQSKRSELRRVAEARLQAYDDLVAAMDAGATDEEVAELLENFQQAMLPELLGWGPVIGEVVKDLVPGLSNVRSVIHAWNDLIEIAEEVEEGDVLGLVGNSGMLVLDLVGIIPVVGSAAALIKTSVKASAKGTVRALGRTAAGRIAKRWMSRRRLGIYLSTTTKKLKSKSVDEYFGKVWDDLPPSMRLLLRKRFPFFVGRAGELAVINRAREAGFNVIDDVGKSLTQNDPFDFKLLPSAA